MAHLVLAAQNEADEVTNKILEHMDQIEGILHRPSQQVMVPSSHQPIHMAKGERLASEQVDELRTHDLSWSEKCILDAEHRAAWRKARLKSLENVRMIP